MHGSERPARNSEVGRSVEVSARAPSSVRTPASKPQLLTRNEITVGMEWSFCDANQRVGP